MWDAAPSLAKAGEEDAMCPWSHEVEMIDGFRVCSMEQDFCWEHDHGEGECDCAETK